MDKILVTRSSMPELEEYVDEIKELWESHWLTNMGVKHKELQNQLTEYMKVENIQLLTNGHMALELVIQALGIKGEVITTPFTFVSTTHAIVRNGLTPVFCDINPIDYTIDTSKLASLITDKTSAIVPVHVYGNICNVEEIQRLADKYGLKVIYDAAHTFGEEYKGRGIGTYGDASCFSFHATKVFNTIEGGAVCYGDKKIGEILYNLKNFGIRGEEIVESVGANAKMNEFQAAMGICNLRHIEREIARRKDVAEQYKRRLCGIEGIQLNTEQKNVKSNYAYFPVIFEKEKFGFNRDEVANKLERHGILSRKYFYPITNMLDCYRELFDVQETPTALFISKNVLTLPLYADLTVQNVDRICDIILEGNK